MGPLLGARLGPSADRLRRRRRPCRRGSLGRRLLSDAPRPGDEPVRRLQHPHGTVSPEVARLLRGQSDRLARPAARVAGRPPLGPAPGDLSVRGGCPLPESPPGGARLGVAGASTPPAPVAAAVGEALCPGFDAAAAVALRPPPG